MFDVSGRLIRVSRGDTGLITFEAEGIDLTENDRAVFKVKNLSGDVMMEKVIAPERNRVTVPFVHEDTEALKPGRYEWDIRYVIDAVEDGDGRVTDGREVLTPFPPGEFRIERTVGEI